MEIEGRTK